MSQWGQFGCRLHSRSNVKQTFPIAWFWFYCPYRVYCPYKVSANHMEEVQLKFETCILCTYSSIRIFADIWRLWVLCCYSGFTDFIWASNPMTYLHLEINCITRYMKVLVTTINIPEHRVFFAACSCSVFVANFKY